MDRQGIPDGLTLEQVREWVRPRNSARRFTHIEGVVDVAGRIAARAGCDVFLAELSGWLHDACKEVKDRQLVEMARSYGLPLDPILEAHGHLLHGPVAAEVARRELGVADQAVLDAVAQHTLGAVPMTPLSKVVFLADCLEAGRPRDYTSPIWATLDLDGACDLDAAIVKACDLGIEHLVAQGKPIHQRTVDVRNYYLASLKERGAKHDGN